MASYRNTAQPPDYAAHVRAVSISEASPSNLTPVGITRSSSDTDTDSLGPLPPPYPGTLPKKASGIVRHGDDCVVKSPPLVCTRLVSATRLLDLLPVNGGGQEAGGAGGGLEKGKDEQLG